MKRIVFRLLKYTFFLALFLFVVFTVLSNLGGNSPVLKEAIENFLKDNTPYEARIEKLNTMNFFPNITIDFEGLELTDTVSGDIAIKVGHFKISMGFFDVLFKTQKFHDLEISHAEFSPKSLLKNSVNVASAHIVKAKDKPIFFLDGTVGAQKFEGSFDLETSGQGIGQKYFVGTRWPFKAQMGATKFSGVVSNDENADLRIDDFIVETNGQGAVKGGFDLRREGMGDFSLAGDLTLLPSGSMVRPNIKLTFGRGPLIITGAIASEKFEAQDLGMRSPVSHLFYSLLAIPQDTAVPPGSDLSVPPDLSGLDFDLDLNVTQLTYGQAPFASLMSKMKIKDGILTLAPLSGTLWDGALTGDVRFETHKEPLRFSASLRSENMPYLGSGKASAAVSFVSEGKTITELQDHLKGTASLAGAGGEMKSQTLDIVSSKLTELLLGSQGAQTLNCSLADLEFAKGRADLKGFLMEGEAITVSGSGFYGLAADTLDLTLHPRLKTAGKTAETIFISGSFTKPEIKDGGFSAGGSGLAAGARVPDASALALSTLTLPSDHACGTRVIQVEKLDAPVPQNSVQKAPAPHVVAP